MARTQSEGEAAAPQNAGTKVRVSLNTTLIDERRVLKSDLTRLDSDYSGEGFRLTQDKPSAELTVSDAILTELKSDGSLSVEPIE